MKILFCVFLCLICPYSAEAAEAEVVISRMEGQARIIRGDRVLQGQPQTQVLLNDVLETAAASKADIVWGGAWGCRLLESSRVKMTGIDTKDQRMELEKGGALFHFKQMPKKSEFQISTPTAIASVRGTQFMVKTFEGKDITTTIAAIHGTVMVTSITTDMRYRLRAGEALDIPFMGKKDFLRQITPEERALLAETSRIRTHFSADKPGY
jgi:ferric-dicitrate binding protein FerR (iron transport regulator)